MVIWVTFPSNESVDWGNLGHLGNFGNLVVWEWFEFKDFGHSGNLGNFGYLGHLPRQWICGSRKLRNFGNLDCFSSASINGISLLELGGQKLKTQYIGIHAHCS